MLNVTIKSNEELSQFIEKIINDNGIKKTWLSEQMGIANQNLNRLINKKNLSLDDVNRILKPLGYSANISIEKD